MFLLRLFFYFLPSSCQSEQQNCQFFLPHSSAQWLATLPWLLQLIPHKFYTALFHHLKQILFLAFTCKTVFCCSWRRIKTTPHYFLLVVDEDQQDGGRLVLEVAGSAKLSAFTAYGRAPVQPSATLSLPNATVCRSNLYQARKQCILWCSMQITPSIMQAPTKHQACD